MGLIALYRSRQWGHLHLDPGIRRWLQEERRPSYLRPLHLRPSHLRPSCRWVRWRAWRRLLLRGPPLLPRWQWQRQKTFNRDVLSHESEDRGRRTVACLYLLPSHKSMQLGCLTLLMTGSTPCWG